MICWHKWSKWEYYTSQARDWRYNYCHGWVQTPHYNEDRMRRFCDKCGKRQDMRDYDRV